MSNTYNQIFTKGTESQLASTPIVNGKIRYTTDTNRFFIDGDVTRQEITDIIKGYTAAEITSLQNPLQNKFYLSSDTKVFYFYTNNAWNVVSGDAASIGYDNTDSGLTATTLQDAIDELESKKLDDYTVITYAEWQLLTPEQKAATNYYIPDYPNEGLTMSADAVTYDNTSSGLTATDAQDAIDEVKSDIPTTVAELSDSTDYVQKTDLASDTNDGLMSSANYKKLNGQLIPSGTDLNTVITPGFYWAAANSTTNAPINGSYGLQVIYGYVRIYQLLYQDGAQYIYMRNSTNSAHTTWSDWHWFMRDDETIKTSSSTLQTIANTASGANAAISLKSNNTRSVADYRDQNGTALGMMGFDSSKKPVIYDVLANAWEEIPVIESGATRNGIFRGKNLGTINSVAELETFLAAHKVSTGEFYDLYLGDYITIQDGTYNAAWMIAGFDTQYNKGNNPYIYTHQITLIPRTTLGNRTMNSTNTTGVSKNTNNPLYATTQGAETAGYQAYYGSDMNQIHIPDLVTNLNTVLSTHLLSQNILLSNTVSNGISSNWSWYTVRARLMNEIEVYGSVAFGGAGRGDALGAGFDTGCDCEKLPVFNYINHVQYSRSGFWLRSVVSSTHFAYADNVGSCSCSSASNSRGFRPLILIG